MEEIRMKYRDYKKSYADCETLYGTYNVVDRTVVVLIPEGRMKPSGVRGRKFHSYELHYDLPDGKRYFSSFRAVCKENAQRQLLKGAPKAANITCERIWM